MPVAIFQVNATDSSLKKKPQTKKQSKTKTLGLELLSNRCLTFFLGEQLCCIRSWQLLTLSQTGCFDLLSDLGRVCVSFHVKKIVLFIA